MAIKFPYKNKSSKLLLREKNPSQKRRNDEIENVTSQSGVDKHRQNTDKMKK